MDQRPVLVFGGSGYIGSRLVLSLLQRRFLVRATSRDMARLRKRPWSAYPGLQRVEADVFDDDSLKKACEGAVVAFYFAQCSDRGYWNFPKLNRQAAERFLKAAEDAGVERIIYLGGLGESESVSSRLLKSRLEVEQILKSGKIPVTVFRAGLILGSGNLAFEILRHLTDRWPLFADTGWMKTDCQPVSVRDVVECLARSLETPGAVGQSFDVGGKEVLPYERFLQIYAEEAGLRRRAILPFRFLGSWLGARWIDFGTPLNGSQALPVLESMKERALCRDTKINDVIPFEYAGPRDAIKTILYETVEILERTLAADALPLEWSMKGDPEGSGGTVFRFADSSVIAALPEDAWRVLSRMGGRTGWYHADWFWTLRGFMDRLLGGKGMTPGRKSDIQLKTGEPMDCWRIQIAEPLRRLLLLSELKMPGRCYWDFRIEAVDSEKVRLSQEMIFIPRGLPGFIFWHAFKKVRRHVFDGAAVAIAKRVSLKII